MIRIFHIELPEHPSAPRLRCWGSDPAAARERTLAMEEIAGMVEEARADAYVLLPEELRRVGQRLFRWLDGPDGCLGEEIAASANQARVLVFALAVPRGLAHLPWEAMHDGTCFLVHALNPPVLTVRWRHAVAEARQPANRPLQALFMACSPRDAHPPLDFEQEEHDILDATGRAPLDLVVEESGSKDELAELVHEHGAGFFDMLHLAGHAERGEDSAPVLAFEDGEGERANAGASALARALPDRPPLVVLSGHSLVTGALAGLAEALVGVGFRAVLAWERAVRPADARAGMRALYHQLAMGEALPLAMARVHARLWEAGARDWYRLRLACAGNPPGALVTPPRSTTRGYAVGRPAESEFLDPFGGVKVAARAAFVGRRRLLQHGVAALRRPDPPRVGLLLRGQGGRGKSSVAARLCDRLRGELQRVVVIGRLDETALVAAWRPYLPDEAAWRNLAEPGDELRFRLAAQLRGDAHAGRLPPLFVLDDFEQNQPGSAAGDIALAPHAASTLAALAWALEHTGIGRLLVTSRYALPHEQERLLDAAPVPPLDPVEQEKLLRRLAHGAGPPDPELAEMTLAAADGNPRLVEWLHAVFTRTNLDAAEIAGALRVEEERFREAILADRLVASLEAAERALLGRMLLLTVPAPLAAVAALDTARPPDELRRALERVARLGLVDVTREAGESLYRVPRQLEALPCLPVPAGASAAPLAGAVLGVLFPLWGGAEVEDDTRAVALLRLAMRAERAAEARALAGAVSTRWLEAYRYAEVITLLEEVIHAAGRHPPLLLNLARAARRLGDVARAGALLREAEATCEERDRAPILYHLGHWLSGRGELDEALRIYREQLVPRLHPNRDARLLAATLRQTADMLHTRGEGDEALRLLRDEVVPVFERLGDERERAVTLGEVADILYSRGELDEALRIRRTEMLPVYERLNDARKRVMVMGKIADVLFARGQLDEALRIRQEQLPIYERLGDVRQRAVVMGKIADIRLRRGDVDEALRIRREEQIPAFEHLADARSRAVALGKIADILALRGEVEEALRIRREEQIPLLDRVGDARGRAVARGKVAGLLNARGEVEESRRIRVEEELPVLERIGDARAIARALGRLTDGCAPGEEADVLRFRMEEQLPMLERAGDVHARAVALGKIADLHARRGEVEEALRIRREEQLPVFTRLGDVRRRAITLRGIAELHPPGGEDEAVRMLRDEVVPVLERLGDVRELIRARTSLARLLRARATAEAIGLLALAHEAAVRCGYREAAGIEALLRELGAPVPPRS